MQIQNNRLKERIEAQELRSSYIDGLVKEGILISLVSDYFNGCSYYYNTQAKEIVEVSGFHTTFPFTPSPPPQSIIQHIREINKELLASYAYA